jgi:hypothetical protein
MLFISWSHIIPSYVRNELKKKTGIIINELGEKMDDNEVTKTEENSNPNDFMLNIKNQNNDKERIQKKEYTSIKSYKPSGNFIYDDDVLNKIEDKFN